MSADISSYQSAEGLTDEQMAALLTDKLGRPISVAGFRTVKSRRGAPDEWLESLGIAPQEPTDRDYRNVVNDDAPDMNQGPHDEPPQATAPVAGVLPFEPATAQMQITLIYTMAGKGAALALRSPQVADIWAQAAPGIAAAYIEWARYNPRVAQVINTLTLGGPGGNLVVMHASLLVSTLIVSGRVNPEQFIPPMGDATDTINEPPPNEGAGNGASTASAKPPRKRRATRADDSAVRGVE